MTKVKRCSLIVASLIGATLACDCDPMNPPNISQVTYGYNLIQANPVDVLNNEQETGRTSTQIFDISTSQTVDNYNVPIGYNLVADAHCGVTINPDLIPGMYSYAQWLSKIVEYETDQSFGWGFGANQTTYDYYSKFYKKNQFLLTQAEYCKFYSVDLDMFNLPPPSDSFLSALMDLTETQLTDQDLEYFYNYVGTHFTYKATMGSALYTSNLFSDIEVLAARSKMNYWKTDSSDSIRTNINWDYTYEANANDKQSLTDYLLSQKKSDFNEVQMSVGVDKNDFSSNQLWAKYTSKDPQPIEQTVKPLYELIASQWLTTQYPQSNLTGTQLTSISSALETYASKYCLDLYKRNDKDQPVSYCQVPQPDPHYGFGDQLTTADDSTIEGVWGPILFPPVKEHSKWYFMKSTSNEAIGGFCVETASQGQECYPKVDHGQTKYPLEVPGLIIGINIFVEKAYAQIVDFGFVYTNEQGIQYTKWALDKFPWFETSWDENDYSTQAEKDIVESWHETWQLIEYQIDDGYMLGLSGRWNDQYDQMSNFIAYQAIMDY